MDDSRTFDIPWRSHGRPSSEPLQIQPNETEDAFRERQHNQQQRQKIYEESLFFRKEEESLREELCEKLWIAMYLQHLAKRIIQKDPVKIVLIPGSAKFPPPSPLQTHSHRPFPGESFETYYEILQQRKRDALIGKEEYWNSLDILANVLKLDVQGQPEEVDIAFRVFTTKSNSSYFKSRGDIRCGNWKDFNISKPTYRTEAEKHIKDYDRSVQTNYVSISTSPGRLWNYIQKVTRDAETSARKPAQIAVIDLRVLKRLGIAYGSTTDDLKFQHWSEYAQTGTKYATKHHCLVLGWLPSQCILGFLSIEDFDILLDASDINLSENVPLSEFEKKISFAAMERYLGVQEQVVLPVRQRADR